jgi:hypothetical protein
VKVGAVVDGEAARQRGEALHPRADDGEAARPLASDCEDAQSRGEALQPRAGKGKTRPHGHAARCFDLAQTMARKHGLLPSTAMQHAPTERCSRLDGHVAGHFDLGPQDGLRRR